MGHSTGKRLSAALDGMEFAVRQPSLKELRRVAFVSSVPFLGFGVMDNAIMIVVSLRHPVGCSRLARRLVAFMLFFARPAIVGVCPFSTRVSNYFSLARGCLKTFALKATWYLLVIANQSSRCSTINSVRFVGKSGLT